MYLYRKYEAYSPIFQGGYVNYIPMVYRFLTENNQDFDDAKSKIFAYISENDLYELSDVTHPLSALEREYVNMTNYFLNQIKIKGSNQVVKDVLNNGYSFEILDFSTLLRLALALDNGEILEITQALSVISVFCNNINIPSIISDDNRQKTFSFYPFDRLNEPKEFIDHHSNNLQKLKNDNMYINYLLDFESDAASMLKKDIISGYYGLLKLKDYFFDFEKVKSNYLLHSLIALNTAEHVQLSKTQMAFKKILNEYTQIKLNEEYKINITI